MPNNFRLFRESNHVNLRLFLALLEQVGGLSDDDCLDIFLEHLAARVLARSDTTHDGGRGTGQDTAAIGSDVALSAAQIIGHLRRQGPQNFARRWRRTRARDGVVHGLPPPANAVTLITWRARWDARRSGTHPRTYRRQEAFAGLLYAHESHGHLHIDVKGFCISPRPNASLYACLYLTITAYHYLLCGSIRISFIVIFVKLVEMKNIPTYCHDK